MACAQARRGGDGKRPCHAKSIADGVSHRSVAACSGWRPTNGPGTRRARADVAHPPRENRANEDDPSKKRFPDVFGGRRPVIAWTRGFEEGMAAILLASGRERWDGAPIQGLEGSCVFQSRWGVAPRWQKAAPLGRRAFGRTNGVG